MADVALVKIRPLQYVKDLRFIPLDQHPMVSKIPLYLETKDKVDLLALGSSLPLYAIAEYDQALFGSPNCRKPEELRRYIGAKYIEKSLSECFGRKFNVANLAIISCMSSDTYIILKHSIECGKIPVSVLLCIAPRDFVDNYARPVGRTPSFEVLEGWKSIAQLNDPKLNSTERRDLLISTVWYFYKVKVDYKTFFTQIFATALCHPTNLYTAHLGNQNAVTQDTSSDEPRDLAGFNDLYAPRYKPPNFKRFPAELEYFEKILILCKKHHIICNVVYMPISPPHSALLDSGLRALCRSRTEGLSHNYDVNFLDCDTAAFLQEDFSDGLHLNAKGGAKWQKKLIPWLEGNIKGRNVE